VYLYTIFILSIAVANGEKTYPDLGVQASLDISTVAEAKDVYWSYMMNIVNQAIIPNMELDSGHIYNNTFYITQDSKNVNVSVDEGKNSIKISANDLEAGFTSSDYLY